MPKTTQWPLGGGGGGGAGMKKTLQFAAYTSDVEGSDIQTLSFPGVTGIVGVRIVVSGAVTNDTATAHARIGVGYWDGTNHRAMSMQASDNDATPNCGVRHDTATIVYFINTVNTNIVAEAEVSSVGDGFVKLHWSDYPGTAILLSVTVYFGDVECNLHSLTPANTVGGTVTKTGLAFAPNALEVLHINGTAFAADSSFTTSALGLGFSVLQSDGTTILQVCEASTGRNLPSANTGVGQVVRDDCVGQKVTVAADGTVTAGARLDVTSYTGDGYVITTRDVAESVNCVVFAINYGAGERWVGVQQMDTNTLGLDSVAISPSFKPDHVDCLGTSLTGKNTVTFAGGGGNVLERVSIGSGTPGSQSCAAHRNDDNLVTSIAKCQTDAKLATGLNTTFALDSFTSTGFDVDVEVAAANDYYIAFQAIRWQDEIFADDDVEISDGAVLAGAGTIVASDTEQIADAPLLIPGHFILANDTENISDAVVFVQVMDEETLVADETEQISDQVLFVFESILVADETETITDGAVLVTPHVVASDTEEISDGCVLVVHKIVCDETEEIGDHCQLVGAALIVASDTEQISDQALLYLGNVLVANDTVEISDVVVFVERRIRAGGWRGTSLQGGAVAGVALDAHMARGGALQ